MYIFKRSERIYEKFHFNILQFFKKADQVEQPEKDKNLTITKSSVVSKSFNGTLQFFLYFHKKLMI